MDRSAYSFEMLPKPPLSLRYAERYGKPYKGPWVWVATRRIRGRNTGYDTCKMVSGIVHRANGNDVLSEVFDEVDRLCRLAGLENRFHPGKYVGLRIYGHNRCYKGSGGEYVTLDTPGVENLYCDWCKKPLIPKADEVEVML